METEIGGQKIVVRGLVRKEIKELRKQGFPLETMGGIEDYEKRDEGLDKLFKLACEGGDPDALTQGEALELWTKVVSETYGGSDLSKKSESPPASTSPGGDSTAGRAEKRGSGRKGTVRKSKKKNG